MHQAEICYNFSILVHLKSPIALGTPQSGKEVIMHDPGRANPKLVEAIEQFHINDHPCLLYETRPEQFAIVVPFIRIGLERGERCLYAAHDNSVDSVLEAMAAGGIDTADALARNALVISTCQDLHLSNSPFEPDRFLGMLKQAIKDAHAAGFTDLRFTGEMTWALEGISGTERFMEYDVKLNDFFLSNDLLALCQYDLTRFSPETLREIILVHPKVISDGVVCRNYSYLPPAEFLQPGRQEFEVKRLMQGLLVNEETIDDLRERNALLNSIFDNTTDAVYVKDLQGRYLMINPAGAAFVGKKIDEVLGRDDRELFPPGSVATILERDRQAMASSVALTTEEVLTMAGATRTYLSTKGPYRDAKGNIIGVFGIARDITERKRFEEELILKSFTLDNIAEEVIWTNAHGDIWNVNDTACKKLGYSRAELLSFSVADIDPVFPKEAWQPHWEEVKRSGSLRLESLHKAKDGHVYPVEVIANYFKQNGLEYVCAIVRDVTEHKKLEQSLRESEEQFRILCDFAPIGIFRADHEGNNTYTNPRWQEIMAMSAPEGIGQRWHTAIHPDDRDEIFKVWLEAAENGRLFSHECRILTPQGKSKWLRALSNPLKNPDGAITGYVGTLEDITELRRSRQELIKHDKLESLGVLAGGIAHDFNNILTAILGNISLARMQSHDPAKAARRLGDAENAAVRARDLAQQLLTFARGGEPVKKTIEVSGLLREAAGFAMHGSTVRCEFELANDLWPVDADEGQIGQVIHNLVINAVQAMPDGGILTIRAENHPSVLEGTRFVKISVADTGIGIPEEHLQSIFDPYFTTKQQGSGLGLATCYAIIKNHGGVITVESTLGKGTTFHVYLPASEQDFEVKPGLPLEVDHASGRILIMDDEEPVREVAQAMLEELGYTVECVENGSEAVALYRKRKEESAPFAAVIMDLTIPGGVGGKEAISSLLKIDPNVKAVVSSGYSADTIVANYRDYGFSAVLGKPYRLQEMSKLLRELLEV